MTAMETTRDTTATAAGATPGGGAADEDRAADPADLAAAANREDFDPRPYLKAFGGRGLYLEVKWRLVWLRRDHPDAHISTELVEWSDRHAIFKATVRIPGGGSATGFKSETAGDFRDYGEKAETGALGRALAALGYGTQFCEDFDEGVGAESGRMRIADSPVDFARRNSDPPRGAAPPGRSSAPVPPGGGGGPRPISAAQQKFLATLRGEAGLDDGEMATWLRELFDVDDVGKLTSRQGSELIDRLQQRRVEAR